MFGSVCRRIALGVFLLSLTGCALNYTDPGRALGPSSGGSGAFFIRGTFDLPDTNREALYVHLKAYDRPLEIEAFTTKQEAQFFRSMYLGGIPYRGQQAWQFTIRQEVSNNQCFSSKTWTLLGWLSTDPKATAPKKGEKYSLFHLGLEPCDDCGAGQFCRFGALVRPHLNLSQDTP